MIQPAKRKLFFTLGFGVVLVALLAPIVITAVRYGVAPGARQALILSVVIASVTCVLAALCFAEVASTVPRLDDTTASATGNRLAWILGWPLLLAFVGNCAQIVAVGARTLGLSVSPPIEQLIHLTTIATLFAFVVACVEVLILRKKYPYAERTFRCPGGPVVPVLGILMCLLLMFSLPTANWLRLGIWLLLGFIIYLAYGQRHSVRKKYIEKHGSAQK